jgi:hypothetical protein
MARECSWNGEWLREDLLSQTEVFEELRDGNSHVFPNTEMDPVHLFHFTCWCQPEFQGHDDNGAAVYLHKTMN